jgi:pimeloyl-ACP methyl ester carboxylesterase
VNYGSIKTAMTFERRIFVTSDRVSIVGDIGGPPDAPAVVLLHGGGQTRHSWAGAMSVLVNEGYRVVNYDARGHGESGWSPTGDYSLAVRAADLETVLRTIDGPVALVGASMGGMTSFYAIGCSSRPIARALVMVDIVLRPSAAGTARIRSFMSAHRDGFASLEEAADAVAAYNPDRPRPDDPSGLLRNLRKHDDGRLYWHWDPRLLDMRPSSEPPEADNALTRVSVNVKLPTLLVRGDRSDVVDDAGVADMRRLVPQTEIYDVLGAGHMVAGDRNDVFNDGVLSFLRRHHPAL